MSDRLLACGALTRTRIFSVGTVLLLAGVLTLPVASASARGRSIPRGFFGTVLNPQILYNPLNRAALDGQMALMARSGVESVRATFDWESIEPARGVFNWSFTDELVATAARHGISLLANVLSTPRWASLNPSSFHYKFYGPRDPQTYAVLLRALIARYGPNGSIWAARGLPRVPIRDWQIWNEEAANFFWAQQPWPKTYTALLRVAYRAIHRAEPGAKVVAGSLAPVYRATPWGEMKALYAAGAKRYFDEISIHPFTIDPRSVSNSVTRVITILNLVRAQMRRNGDAHKPIIITELAWPAALRHVAKRRLLGLETTTRGESLRLAAAYATLGREHATLGLTHVYWFTWASFFNPNDPLSDVSYDFSGLTRYGAPPVTFTPQPSLAAYTRVARQLEGCRKSSNALHPC